MEDLILEVYRGKLQIGTNRRELTKAAKRRVLERDKHLCQYCYGEADCVDHILAQCYIHRNDEDNLVASCMFCNLMASGRFFETFELKRIYVQDKILKLLRKTKVTVWTKDEFEQLGRSLRRRIHGNIILVDTYREQDHISRILNKQHDRIIGAIENELLCRDV